MKSLFLVPVFCATAFSYAMENNKIDIAKFSPRYEEQIKRSPRMLISHEESSGQTVSKPMNMQSPSPQRERTHSGGSPIMRVRAQSNGSPRFIEEENMHRFIKEQQSKKETK